MDFMKKLKYDEKGLIPTIAQDYKTGEVLMCAYMNEESLGKTIETGTATYFSRSRNELWTKGETTGHFQNVKEIRVDCDNDTLLLKVEQVGVACHTNNPSCFYRRLEAENLVEIPTGKNARQGILYDVYNVICDRLENPKEGSYTNYLFGKGLDKMLKKVGEEASEVIIAAKNREKDEVKYEVADLLYHLSVVLVEQGVNWDDIFKELEGRYGKPA